MTNYTIPRANAPIAGAEAPTPSWYNFLRYLDARTSSAAGDVQAEITTIAEKLGSPDGTVGNIPPLKSFYGLVGIQSISAIENVDKSLTVSLVNDSYAPSPVSYYGSDSAGAKGWHLVYDAFASTANIDAINTEGIVSFDLTDLTDSGVGTLLATTFDAKGRKTGSRAATITGTAGRITVANGDASAGLPTIDLATITDAGGGALLRFVRDAWGRLAGTSAATTDDLTEGSRLYYTDARADARITLQKAQPLGLATLDAGGKLDAGQLPALAITETFVVADEAAMLALTAQQGDVAVRTDLSESFILTASPASTLSNWQELLTPMSPVTSVFGRTGSVTAASGDYTKAQVGLGNVDNTADNVKPVSTAQAAADALRVLKAGDTMTGPLVLPADPTLALQAAPKQYVDTLPTRLAPVSTTVTAETYQTAAGGETSGTLTIAGLPLAGIPTVTAIHQTDWQGRVALSAAARTNNAYPSEPTLATAAAKGGTPTPLDGTIATFSASFTPNGIEFPPNPTLQQIAYVNTSIDYTTVTAGMPLYFGILVKSTSSTAPTLPGNFNLAAYSRLVTIDSLAVIAAGPNCWYYTGVGHLNNPPNAVNYFGATRPIADPTPGEAYTVSAFMFSLNAADVGAYIPTTTAAVTVTDYTLSGSSVSYGQAATAGALYDWDGAGTAKYPASFAGPVKVGEYTLATLPDVSTYDGSLIRVTDATAGPALCLSNGTNWIDIRTNATVS